jgi:Holliday junction resolvase RusA-like endonuclease
MKTKIDIPGRFPGMNEMIEAAKKGRGKYQPYADMKAEYTDMVAWCAKMLPKYNYIDIKITWHEPNVKRDPDNIEAGAKFILDGLKEAGTIPDDSQKFIHSVLHRVEVDPKNPRVEIEVEEFLNGGEK